MNETSYDTIRGYLHVMMNETTHEMKDEKIHVQKKKQIPKLFESLALKCPSVPILFLSLLHSLLHQLAKRFLSFLRKQIRMQRKGTTK
jgi:hypothetical protein